ncbi:hypothetical protein COCSADRAFT_320360 [Bipolaris sorokiniana ND90Pr]|uniref:Uncharacterized protein n=1 Tax=Cochliobolus sativus (strain ND90Pr / ATCC 201652) TaxID=665912 RepID=M2T4W0_COCSN|nr:uncharacterized protein COCSADRAFT_320360 [Bipolaris sorokiniana ND90Pr]EMD64027.1 hypothetical protein COCSADRAFT_320360 [Bipolaris sorokiniana ND90Pr]
MPSTSYALGTSFSPCHHPTLPLLHTASTTRACSTSPVPGHSHPSGCTLLSIARSTAPACSAAGPGLARRSRPPVASPSGDCPNFLSYGGNTASCNRMGV